MLEKEVRKNLLHGDERGYCRAAGLTGFLRSDDRRRQTLAALVAANRVLALVGPKSDIKRVSGVPNNMHFLRLRTGEVLLFTGHKEL